MDENVISIKAWLKVNCQVFIKRFTLIVSVISRDVGTIQVAV